MLGCDFVLYRDRSNKVICLSDVCCHRGASLAHGKIVSDGCAVACPFHGWEFEQSGVCTHIPSLGNRPIPDKARVDSYPTKELYDLVWVFLGDLPEDQRPDLPDLLPEFYEMEDWRSTHVRSDLPVNWTKAEENAIDVAHLSFVHTAFTDRQDPEVTFAEVEHFPHGARIRRELSSPRTVPNDVLGRLLPKESSKTTVTLEFSVIGISHRIHPVFRQGMSQIIFSTTTPVDEQNCRVYMVQARNYATGGEYDQDRIQGRRAAMAEDLKVLENVRPRVGPTAIEDELFVEADGMEAAFRTAVAQFVDKGYLIDSQKVAQDYDRKVYVIPSPARHAEPENWVHAPIPTTRPRQALT